MELALLELKFRYENVVPAASTELIEQVSIKFRDRDSISMLAAFPWYLETAS